MSHATDRSLVDFWFREHSARVFSYLLHRTDQQSAEDLLQEVFVVAFRKAPAVPEQPLGWLFATARRLLANHTRARTRQQHMLSQLRVAESVGPVSDDIATTHARWSFLELLSQLSEADQEVLTLAAWYGLSPAEAAQALDCRPNTYSVRLHRARQRLADLIHQAGDNPAHLPTPSEVLHVVD